MPKLELPEGYVNQTFIKGRGWTQGQIDYLLGEPEFLMEYKNAHGYKMKLYKATKVLEFERDKRMVEDTYHLKRNVNVPKLLKMGLDSCDYREPTGKEGMVLTPNSLNMPSID